MCSVVWCGVVWCVCGVMCGMWCVVWCGACACVNAYAQTLLNNRFFLFDALLKGPTNIFTSPTTLIIRCNGPRVVPCRKSAEVCILRIAHANAVDDVQPA